MIKKYNSKIKVDKTIKHYKVDKVFLKSTLNISDKVVILQMAAEYISYT